MVAELQNRGWIQSQNRNWQSKERRQDLCRCPETLTPQSSHQNPGGKPQAEGDKDTRRGEVARGDSHPCVCPTIYLGAKPLARHFACTIRCSPPHHLAKACSITLVSGEDTEWLINLPKVMLLGGPCPPGPCPRSVTLPTGSLPQCPCILLPNTSSSRLEQA